MHDEAVAGVMSGLVQLYEQREKLDAELERINRQIQAQRGALQALNLLAEQDDSEITGEENDVVSE